MTTTKRFDKPDWHKRNYEFLRKRPCFQRGKFIGSYFEIVDEGFDESPPIYEHLKDGQLVAVNNDPAIIYELTKKTNRTLVCGDAFDVAYDLCGDPRLPQVGVYVMDTQTSAGDSFWKSVGKARLWEVVRSTNARYVDTMKTRLGCGLILNFVLDPLYSTKAPSELARQHVDGLEAFLKSLVSGSVPSLRGPNPEQLDSLAYVGMWGPHEVYRSSVRRMITTRLWIQGSKIVLET